VVVTNIANAVTSADATLSFCVPPRIIYTCPDVVTNIGALAGLYVLVETNVLTPTYQWSPNKPDVMLASCPEYTLIQLMMHVYAGDVGNYSVVISNAAGSITSSVMNVSLIGPPVIVAQPVDQLVNSNANASFLVTCSGTPPLGYQWRFGGRISLARPAATICGLTSKRLMLDTTVLSSQTPMGVSPAAWPRFR